MNLLGSFVIAFSMYSRLPMPQVEWTKERMKYAMCFFPLIGVIIGLLEYAFYSICDLYGFQHFRQFLPVLFPILITGGIHMDGLLDVIDARSSHAETDKKLEILKDPHTGAFAIIGCSVYLILYLAAFMEISTKMIPAYCFIFIITRALSGLSVVTFPMAKKNGLAAAFSSAAQKRSVGIVMIIYLIAAESGVYYLGGMVAAIVLFCTAIFIYIYYYMMAMREFGGITGDLAGYFLQILELAFVIALAVVSRL